MIVGADWGGKFTKLVTPSKIEVFPSDLMFSTKIKVTNELRKHDFIFEYQGRKGIAGTLAQDERTVLDRNRRGDSKLHDDALIRLLIALHQYTEGPVKVVVGQPISKHEEKHKIRAKLLDTHTITVNGETKHITIEDAAVGVEGGSAIFSSPMNERVHLIDIGSGTINFATILNGRFINSQSDTIAKGIENLEHDYQAIADNIENVAIDLSWGRNRYLLGGGAHVLKGYLPYPVFHPVLNGNRYGPELANAIGFYKVGEMLWQRKSSLKL